MLKVEETLAAYLSHDAASSLKAPTLSTKPYRVTSSLVGKVYKAAGQAGACLHTMAILQVYQADLLKDLHKGEGAQPDDIKELHGATGQSRSSFTNQCIQLGDMYYLQRVQTSVQV